FQWSARAHYVLDLKASYLAGCMLIAEKAYTRISPEDRDAIVAASVIARARFMEISRETDEALLNGAFQKQGATVVRPSPRFSEEYLAAAAAARSAVAERFVGPDLLSSVMRWLEKPSH